MDSALNLWLNGVPDYRRYLWTNDNARYSSNTTLSPVTWDSSIQDPARFQLTADLRLLFHYVQILVHRPFIPLIYVSDDDTSPLAFSSLAVCTNAARSAIGILEIYRQRKYPIMPLAAHTAFMSGIVLLISVWGIKKKQMRVDLSKHVEDVQKCIAFLHSVEVRWKVGGVFA